MKSSILTILFVIFYAPLAIGNTKDKCSNSMQVIAESAWTGKITNELIKHAIETCQEPAKNGYVEAQYDLSILHLLENNKKENEQSFLWTKKAAQSNHIDAQYRLGNIYETGIVTPKDNTKADRWYNMAAEKGYVLAQRKLGDNYTKKGQEKPIFLKGLYWYEKAAD